MSRGVSAPIARPLLSSAFLIRQAFPTRHPFAVVHPTKKAPARERKVSAWGGALCQKQTKCFAAPTHRYISTGQSENKFRIGLDRVAAVYERAASMAGIRIRGVQMHIGSLARRLPSPNRSLPRLKYLNHSLPIFGKHGRSNSEGFVAALELIRRRQGLEASISDEIEPGF